MALHKSVSMHPGKFLKVAYMEPSGLGVNSLAKELGVTGATVSRLISGKSDLTAEMAIKLEKRFKKSAKSWLIMQVDYNLTALQK